MKVGIVTFNEAINFGAHLQAYALQEYIRLLGHESYQVKIENDYQKIFVPFTNFHSILANLRRVIFYPRFKRKLEKFLSFEKEYIHYTDWVANESTIGRYENDFDVWVSGSDQVWNCTEGINSIFFLEFVTNKKKIAYAASMGEPKVNELDYNRFCNCLKRFDMISVREDSIQAFISKASSLAVSCVLDPVFLLSKEHWNKFVYNIYKKYIFVYATQISEELVTIIKELQNKTGYEIYSIHKLPGLKAKVLEYKSGPSDFLSYIANAQYVITSSFHCTAFSVIFEKRFVTISHSKTGARTNDLLAKFGIDNEKAKNNVYGFFEDIGYDYSEIRIKKEHFIKDSMEFLAQALVEE